jgi:DNA topoisomerase VI subunit A
MIGALQFDDQNNNRIDCSVRPITITLLMYRLHNVVSNANAILIVEKDATFQKMCDEGFRIKYPNIILITVCCCHLFLTIVDI